MQTRREVIERSAAVASLLAAAGTWPGIAFAESGWAKAAFEAKSIAELSKALGIAAPVQSKDVLLQSPDIAENGTVVPIGATATLPGVTRLLLLVEKNPNLLAAAFDITDSIEPSISTRVKMGESSDVYAVALMADGRALYASREVKITLGGCGG